MQLPKVVLLNIFSFLNTKELISAKKTCKKFNTLITEEKNLFYSKLSLEKREKLDKLLFSAVRDGDSIGVVRYCGFGANPNKFIFSDTYKMDGFFSSSDRILKKPTLLHFVALQYSGPNTSLNKLSASKGIDILKSLLKAGANIDADSEVESYKTETETKMVGFRNQSGVYETTHRRVLVGSYHCKPIYCAKNATIKSILLIAKFEKNWKMKIVNEDIFNLNSNNSFDLSTIKQYCKDLCEENDAFKGYTALFKKEEINWLKSNEKIKNEIETLSTTSTCSIF